MTNLLRRILSFCRRGISAKIQFKGLLVFFFAKEHVLQLLSTGLKSPFNERTAYLTIRNLTVWTKLPYLPRMWLRWATNCF